MLENGRGASACSSGRSPRPVLSWPSKLLAYRSTYHSSRGLEGCDLGQRRFDPALALLGADVDALRAHEGNVSDAKKPKEASEIGL